MKFKPYQVVIAKRVVGNFEFEAYGEVMSMRTPAGTYMVRLVPGLPGSLAEIHEDKMRSTSEHVQYIHYATVGGSGSFPLDMLRYDFCQPVNFRVEENERYRLKAIVTFQVEEDALVVAAASSKRYPQWTVARWSSFLWGIRELKTLGLVVGDTYPV